MRTPAFVATAAGILASIAAFAQGPVYSVNIVGFQKVTPSNSFTQVSNPFVKGSFSLDSVIGDQLVGGLDPDASDNVLYWNGVEYLRFFKADGTGDPQVDGKWLDEGLGSASLNVAPGVGFWVKNNNISSNSTFVMVGDVEMSATKTSTINPGFSMISYPYSTSVSINSTNFVGLAEGAQGGLDIDSADNLYYWNGAEYIRYFLVAGSGDPNLDGKWIDEGLSVANFTLQPGNSIWYLRRGSTAISWVASRPY